MKNSCVQIYCGDGKGKTTAAVGLAVRASGAKLSVLFMQFMKNGTSSEIGQLKAMEYVTVATVENPFGFTWNMTEDEKQSLRKRNTEAVIQCMQYIEQKQYDVMILDEIISAYQNELVDQNLVEQLVQNHGETEVVLTGRNPDDKLIKMSDYVSEIRAVKHPYENGVNARYGIEY